MTGPASVVAPRVAGVVAHGSAADAAWAVVAHGPAGDAAWAAAAAVLAVVLAYLVGSIPTGVIAARTRGVDIRAVGSGNIGATNVARSLGARLGVVVLVLDALKGALPMLAVGAADLGARVHPLAITATGVAAICGHCYSVWLRFRGGKGVATALGVFAVVAPAALGVGAAAFAAAYAAARVVSIGSLLGAATVPAAMWLLGYPDEVVALGVAVLAIIVVQHRGNIRRLLRRAENKM